MIRSCQFDRRQAAALPFIVLNG